MVGGSVRCPQPLLGIRDDGVVDKLAKGPLARAGRSCGLSSALWLQSSYQTRPSRLRAMCVGMS